MEKILALQKEHNLTLPDEFHFKYARVALSADSLKIALESVNKYLSTTGKEGEFYKEALALLFDVEVAQETQISVEETCAGDPERSKNKIICRNPNWHSFCRLKGRVNDIPAIHQHNRFLRG